MTASWSLALGKVIPGVLPFLRYDSLVHGIDFE